MLQLNPHQVVDEDGRHHKQESRDAEVCEAVCMRAQEERPAVVCLK